MTGTAIHKSPSVAAPTRTALRTSQDAAHSDIPLPAIARSFGLAAPHYDEHAQLQREVADTLMAQISVEQPALILDLGCGTGYCSKGLRASFPTAPIVALDVALPMLQATQARGIAEVLAICGDAQALPLQDACADLVVSSLAMQWCQNLPRLFEELLRITRSGGEVLLSTFGPATLQEVRAAWAAVNGAVHVNEFATLTSLEAAATACGFIWRSVTERRERHYGSLREVARELKGVGAHNMNAGRSSGLTGRRAFAQAEAEFNRALLPGKGIAVTWEVHYLLLRKPA